MVGIVIALFFGPRALPGAHGDSSTHVIGDPQLDARFVLYTEEPDSARASSFNLTSSRRSLGSIRS